MTGEWKVLSNPVGDHFLYQVYRIRDPRKPMHSGNIETNGTFKTENEAKAWAEMLNKESLCT